MQKRRHDLSHSMAHYLLTIHKLKEKRGFARVTDIARDLDLTKGSVSTAINNLKKKGLVCEEDDCKFLVLTDEGHDEVHEILSSRTLLFYFLRDFLKVEEGTALTDACLMEHLMSQETRDKLFSYIKDSGSVSELDLDGFKDAESFIREQKSDGEISNS